ncbi:acyl-CoA thioesterase [Telmatocola sphagniphila]|uniref:Acyl-CoA thioesterase n=1 Tax=Telmatocola sphagniphila TaxID=1123043 RepID=A0A8E6B6D7_9BACT|nr:thioesterase family protein [Telmatocola sphagniphila]QVL31368.1 acyl-CoA thioesterase [Telmatocola sphagniphila]
MSAPFSIERRVEFGDTDLAGIVHFSNFFKYMEVAETAFLRSHGLSVSWSQDGERRGFPRVSTTCDFKQPAFFEDVLTISVTLERLGKKSLSYRFDFRRGNDEIAVGRLTSVYCRSTPEHRVESMEIPSEIRQKLS